MQAGLPPELDALKNTIRQIVKDECYPLEAEFLTNPTREGGDEGAPRGIAEALSGRLPVDPTSSARLKWPNDVTVGGKKICGVLVDPLPPTVDTLAAVVVGVGVNINNRVEADLADRATSLAAELGANVPLDDCLVEILEQVDHQIEAWRTGDSRLPERWNRSCQDLGRRLSVETPGGRVEGTCREIDPEGRLVLERPDGSLQAIVSETGDGQSN